jgi:DNA-binding HxlR family transcriptional regulator
MEERDMLAEMGIIEQEPRPEQLDDIRDFRLTKLGKEVVVACEGLYTSEEYETRDAEARVELDQLRQERAERLGL